MHLCLRRLKKFAIVSLKIPADIFEHSSTSVGCGSRMCYTRIIRSCCIGGISVTFQYMIRVMVEIRGQTPAKD